MPSDPVLDALGEELARALAGAAREPDPPYFLAFRVTEESSRTIVATEGATRRDHRQTRDLQVDARVGDHHLDSTRGLGPWDDDEPDTYVLPVEDDVTALRANAWLAAADAIRCARARIEKVRTEVVERAREEEQAGDLSEETPVVAIGPREAPIELPAGWDDVLARASLAMGDPRVVRASASLRSEGRVVWIATSEGTRVRESRRFLVLTLAAEAIAADGMWVPLSWRKVVASAARLPSPEDVVARAAALADEVIALRDAPRGEPYAGPILLRGASAGVWVHEVLGHRAEGHRIKDDFEGQTFRGYVGTPILPRHVDVFDDPRLDELFGEDLYGHYLHDDEGRPAERVDVVVAGAFAGFLMGRSPIPGSPRSNGHGRADAHSRPVSRMGNTVLVTREPTPFGDLRARLVEEARRQGLSHALLVDDLAGGFTLTGRVLPNSFVLTAWRAWKVHVDGRPDTLVRGLDLVGTPLACLGTLLAAGDDPGVFAGHCGAESGSIPVTAIAPSLLFGRMEAQRQSQDHDAPPQAERPAPGETDADTLAGVLARARETLAADAHFVGLTCTRARKSDVRAEHGAIVRDSHAPDHRLAVDVRLGTPEADNGGAEYPQGFAGSGALADAPAAVGAEAWRLLYECRKGAARSLAERLAASRRRAG
ncbi:MAG: metallopeptidase TldD-related protein, partial [Myxococcota bacterium]